MNATDAQQDIAFIRNIIDENRSIIADNGLGFVLWGLLISIGLLTNYIAIVTGFSWDIQIVWLFIFAIAIALTLWGIIQERRSKKVETLAGRFLGAIWIGVIVTMTINGFLGSMHPALAASILGMAYFPTGYATGFSVFRYLAGGWWIAAGIMFIYPGLYTILLLAVLLIVFQVIPGLVIYRKCKKELSPAAPLTV